jgi:Retroviral aspartyl protease
LARQVEKSLDSHNKMIKNMVKPSYHSFFPSKSFKPREDTTLISSSHPLRLPAPFGNRQLTLKQKKILGLCFKCGEKKKIQDTCKFKDLHLMEGDAISDSDISLEEENLNTSLTNTVKPNTAIITLCAATHPNNHSTLLFQGSINNLGVIIMVDGGSTHSFINFSILVVLVIPTIMTQPLSVTTASGVRLSTNTVCSQLCFQLQRHTFQSAFHVLHVTRHDMILGMDWFHSHSPVTFDSSAGTLTVQLKGNRVILKIKPLTSSLHLCEHVPAVPKKIHQVHSFFLAHLFSAEADCTSSTSSPLPLPIQ